ncbi:MAG: metalloregulator ArsR/SmtB family transcription factor [Alphaproteobacteria bacterium]|nr:metalloregulator ArsR/SmtB family transcription factor [Alphaproteobacteria bacterium]
MTESDLNTLLDFFKALANESRLRIVGVLARREATVGELAALLDLKEPTVSHHLARLRDLGLVTRTIDGTTHTYRLCAQRIEALSKQVLSSDTVAAATASLDHDAFAAKVHDSFIDGERLVAIPASRRKREVILQWLVERIEPDHHYGELELNALIKQHHPDTATLRRELVGAGLLVREKSVYWRPSEGVPTLA